MSLYDVENRLVEKRVQTNADCENLSFARALEAQMRYDPMGRLYSTIRPTLRSAFNGLFMTAMR